MDLDGAALQEVRTLLVILSLIAIRSPDQESREEEED